jgi:phosphoesterase RecJ-like protein
MGSAMGLWLILKKLGHEVKVVSPNDFPGFLKWMAGQQEVVVYDKKPDQSEELINSAEVIFSMDYSSLDRIGELGEMVRHSSAVKVVIDHHRNPEDFADFVEWNIEAGATGELLYDLIKELGWTGMIGTAEANCLYAGIMTDTGGFRHPNTSQHIHHIVAELIALGADTAKVSKLVYDSNSVNRLRLLGFALNERMVVLDEYKVAYIYLSAADLKRFKAQQGDTEGLVNYALSIVGITMAALFTEKDNVVRISFRSVGDFSVNDFARKNFAGGGHINAAGGKSTLSLEDTIQKFESLLPEYKLELVQTEQKLYA